MRASTSPVRLSLSPRGETNFFADKANVAVDMGAIATVVYNNEPGTINMILTGYYEEAPAYSSPRPVET